MWLFDFREGLSIEQNAFLLSCVVVGVLAFALWRATRLPGEQAVVDSRAEDSPQHENANTTPSNEEANQQQNQWHIVEHSLRTSGVASGEGPVVMLGYAEVTEARGERKLYHCSLFDVAHAYQYIELRVASSSFAGLLRREVKITLDPGNILWSELTWSPEDGTAAPPNVVANARTVLEGARQLLDGAERMVVVWTDTIGPDPDTATLQVNRLVVGLEGFSEVMDRLSRHGFSVQSATPAPF